jgi:hypothetical protein
VFFINFDNVVKLDCINLIYCFLLVILVAKIAILYALLLCVYNMWEVATSRYVCMMILCVFYFVSVFFPS